MTDHKAEIFLLLLCRGVSLKLGCTEAGLVPFIGEGCQLALIIIILEKAVSVDAMLLSQLNQKTV